MQRRLWTIGSLEHGLIPTEAQIQKIVSILEDESITDIVVGPDVKMQIMDDDDDKRIYVEVDDEN